MQIGSLIEMGFPTAHGKRLKTTRYHGPYRVIEIFARRDNINGQRFVCGYRECGENARMSFSVIEGDEHIRLART